MVSMSHPSLALALDGPAGRGHDVLAREADLGEDSVAGPCGGEAVGDALDLLAEHPEETEKVVVTVGESA
jgi:hypothetical protein